MAEGNDTANGSMAQQLLFQQHRQLLFLMQQQQLQLQQQRLQRRQQQQQQQSQPSAHHQSPYNLLQQQQAISRFPSNIDAHLRAPSLRSLHFQAPTPPAAAQPSSSQPLPSSVLHHPPQPQSARPAAVGVEVGVGRPGNPVEVEMAQKDALMVCNPDFKCPFASVEDAVLRLLPYHVVSDYEAEEDDRTLDGDTLGHIISRLQQWDQNILTKIAEFTTTFEKQVLAFNILSRKRAQGEFRSEERLMIEQALMQEEKQALLEIRAEMESREKAGREATEAKMWMAMAQAEHARAEAQVHAEMYACAPMRVSTATSLGDEGSDHDMGQEQGGNMDEIHGWGSTQIGDEEPSQDFLNDENGTENVDTRAQGEWREAGELDLNSR